MKKECAKMIILGILVYVTRQVSMLRCGVHYFSNKIFRCRKHVLKKEQKFNDSGYSPY
jgi:hypothetical protein